MITTIFTTMTIFTQISSKIIKEQELIIGPMAWQEARKVPGLTVVNQSTGEVSFIGDEKEIVNTLVAQYVRLFGRASSEVCKDAAKDLLKGLPTEEIPASLK